MQAAPPKGAKVSKELKAIIEQLEKQPEGVKTEGLLAGIVTAKAPGRCYIMRGAYALQNIKHLSFEKVLLHMGWCLPLCYASHSKVHKAAGNYS
eukprot:1148607-Pelagomonas_calceolata.AAC.4